jgi:FkbM family methyltransferase
MTILAKEGEFTGNNLINTRCHEYAVGELIWRLVKPGDTVVDVGANIGYFTLLFAYRCMPSGKCLSIEADPNIYEQLKRNVEANRLSEIVTTVSAAASYANGSLYFQRATGRNYGLGRVLPIDAVPRGCDALKVESIALDAHIADLNRIRVVKIDVEGHEHEVLKGMSKALAAKSIESIIFEDHVRTPSHSVQFLTISGYKVLRLERTVRGPRLLDIRSASGESGPANFVATLEPEKLLSITRSPGWHVF